jgi:hypothetical protein
MRHDLKRPSNLDQRGFVRWSMPYILLSMHKNPKGLANEDIVTADFRHVDLQATRAGGGNDRLRRPAPLIGHRATKRP